jgi:proteasome alpha subunit
VETATKHVTEFVQRYTQVGGARPFGVALLVAGVDRDGTPRLYETDPSGTSHEWRAVAVGADRAVIQDYREEHNHDGLGLDGGIEFALRALATPEGTDDPDATGIGVATVDAESDRYVRLTDDEVAEYLDGLDLATAGDDEEATGDGETPDVSDDEDGERADDEGDADDPDVGAE